ncbi:MULTISPECIES: hypothetical protein [Actinoplanes]|uniref:hypothetical protein n=1 Tax=Actinoplanes TaxID=1865 RepID=UPI0005F2912A|nr:MULTISPECIES: hypothetical protein [Actinoplanes]
MITGAFGRAGARAGAAVARRDGADAVAGPPGTPRRPPGCAGRAAVISPRFGSGRPGPLTRRDGAVIPVRT